MDTSKNTYIIAECACEHGGDVDAARNMIDEAKFTGADCVKFQLFFEDEVGSLMWGKIKDYHLNPNEINALRCHANEAEIDFLCSPFGLCSQDELSAIGCKTIKVPAPCNEWKEYFEWAREKFNHLIISSGMAQVMSRLWRAGDEVLLCTSSYPCPYDQVHLNAIHDYDGISDHTRGDHVATSAVALGARIVEKHMTCGIGGPDKATSLGVLEFKEMVDKIRNIESAMGYEFKHIQPSERKLLWRKRK